MQTDSFSPPCRNMRELHFSHKSQHFLPLKFQLLLLIFLSPGAQVRQLSFQVFWTSPLLCLGPTDAVHSVSFLLYWNKCLSLIQTQTLLSLLDTHTQLFHRVCPLPCHASVPPVIDVLSNRKKSPSPSKQTKPFPCSYIWFNYDSVALVLLAVKLGRDTKALGKILWDIWCLWSSQSHWSVAHMGLQSRHLLLSALIWESCPWNEW